MHAFYFIYCSRLSVSLLCLYYNIVDSLWLDSPWTPVLLLLNVFTIIINGSMESPEYSNQHQALCYPLLSFPCTCIKQRFIMSNKGNSESDGWSGSYHLLGIVLICDMAILPGLALAASLILVLWRWCCSTVKFASMEVFIISSMCS